MCLVRIFASISFHFVVKKLLTLLIEEMNSNIKGMLYTAGAVVVGILVAKMVEKQLMKSEGEGI